MSFQVQTGQCQGNIFTKPDRGLQIPSGGVTSTGALSDWVIRPESSTYDSDL